MGLLLWNRPHTPHQFNTKPVFSSIPFYPLLRQMWYEEQAQFLGRTLLTHPDWVLTKSWLKTRARSLLRLAYSGWDGLCCLALPIKSNWHSRASSSDQSAFSKLGHIIWKLFLLPTTTLLFDAVQICCTNYMPQPLQVKTHNWISKKNQKCSSQLHYTWEEILKWTFSTIIETLKKLFSILK